MGDPGVKRLRLLCLVIGLMALLAFTGALAESKDDRRFVMPSSLRVIGDNGFDGTGPRIVILPEKLESIGREAFNNAPNLYTVYIPKSTKEIGDRAFGDPSKVVLAGESGSYAQEWAKAHGYTFVVVNVPLLSGSGDPDPPHEDKSMGASPEDDGVPPQRDADAMRMTVNPRDNPNMPPIDYFFP